MLTRTCILILILLTAAAIHSLAGHLAAEKDVSAPAHAAGLRVVIDPATGEIVGQPTAAQLGRLDRTAAWSKGRRDTDLRRFDLPGGGEGVALEGWAIHTMQMVRGNDGVLRTVCSQGDEHGGER